MEYVSTFEYHKFWQFFLTKFAFFSGCLKIFILLKFFQLQGPGNLLVSSNNGMVFNVLVSRILAFFIKSANFQVFKVFSSSCQFLIFVHSQVRENLFHVLIKSYCMLFSFNEFVFSNLAFRLLEVF